MLKHKSLNFFKLRIADLGDSKLVNAVNDAHALSEVFTK